MDQILKYIAIFSKNQRIPGKPRKLGTLPNLGPSAHEYHSEESFSGIMNGSRTRPNKSLQIFLRKQKRENSLVLYIQMQKLYMNLSEEERKFQAATYIQNVNTIVNSNGE
ncbi:hypothetical protein NQ317_011498 [Molorchus minor]|uniref:Uncharacterized protein n=1 Tax=Molorchus minor TaxID=1323400 RepID=A0ABQ9J231_9CUCU|nr:hypothetical protein NQ317_011498 [Molorchus minor]